MNSTYERDSMRDALTARFALFAAAALLAAGCGSNKASSTYYACTDCHDVTKLQGAHSVHVNGATYSAGFACTECHEDRLGSHATLPLSVSFGSLANRTDRTLDDSLSKDRSGASNAAHFDTSAKTCSSVYCHGATVDGAAGSTTAAWDSGTALADCSSCHSSPPSLNGFHPDASYGTCDACHAGTTTRDSTGTYSIVRAGGLHVNGVSNYDDGAILHQTEWTPDGHSTDIKYKTCLPCHSFKTMCDTCVACHGEKKGCTD